MTGEAPRKMGVTGGREGAGWARMGRARAGRTLGVVVTGARTLGVTAPPVCSKYVIIKKIHCCCMIVMPVMICPTLAGTTTGF